MHRFTCSKPYESFLHALNKRLVNKVGEKWLHHTSPEKDDRDTAGGRSSGGNRGTKSMQLDSSIMLRGGGGCGRREGSGGYGYNGGGYGGGVTVVRVEATMVAIVVDLATRVVNVVVVVPLTLARGIRA
ncbi:hypothetical protein LguiA_023352 [Lonicera macranthoides]